MWSWRSQKEDPDTSKESEDTEEAGEGTVYLSDDDSVIHLPKEETKMSAPKAGKSSSKSNPEVADSGNESGQEDPMDASATFKPAEGETPEDTRLRRSWAGTRGHITRQIKNAQTIVRACPNYQATNQTAVEQARACSEKLRKLIDDLEAKSQAIIERMSRRAKKYVKYINDANVEVGPALEALAAIRNPPQPGGAPQEQGGAQPAAELHQAAGGIMAAASTAIRPEKLSFENSPTEFREWKE